MKKIVSLIAVSASLLVGCHSNNTPANIGTNNSASNTVTASADTAKHHTVTIAQPAADPNIKDGPLVKYYPNGVIKEKSYYVSGRRQGECQSFYPNGKLQSDDFFAGGLIDGSTNVYYDNGQKEYEGVCTKGKPSGIWKFYDNKGKLVRTKDYGEVKTSPAI